MATRRAVANGNWSATGTWNGGVAPTDGDTVYSNGFNITLDVDVNIGGANNPTVSAGSFVSGQWYEIDFVGTTSWTGIGATSNTTGTVFLATGVGTGTGTAKALATLTTALNAAAGAAAGGSFVMSTVRAMTCDLRAATTTCLNVTATTGTLTLSGIRVGGGTAANAHGINNNSTATIVLAGGTYFGGTTTNANSLNNASVGTVNVTGACAFIGGTNANTLNNASTGSVNVSDSCTFTGGSTNGITLNNASTGSVNVSASCTFTGGGAGSHALNNASTGSVNVSAPCTFTGSASANNSGGLSNASTGIVIVTQSTFTASAFANAVSISSVLADVRLSGDFLDHWSGWKAVSGGKWRIGTAPTLGQHRFALAGTTGSYFTMYGADNGAFGNPIAANVRSGIVYGGGNLTGTCAVPAEGSVALGVPVDAGFGTAVLTLANVRAAIGMASANLDTQLAAIPTAAGNASAVRTELAPELARVTEIHAIHGLDIANALTITPTLRAAGAITQAITGDGTTSTIVTRV